LKVICDPSFYSVNDEREEDTVGREDNGPGKGEVKRSFLIPSFIPHKIISSAAGKGF